MADQFDPNDPTYKANKGWQFIAREGEPAMWHPKYDEGDNTATGDPFAASGRNSAGGAADDVAGALGYAPKQVDPGAPGGLLDTAQADEERRQTGVLIGQLQQQAATGGGAWEGSLADATQRAKSSAAALGQSQPGAHYQSALRNIGNAQGAVAQKSVGQGNILRAQSKAGAQDQLSSLLASQGGTDANQAASNAVAQQGISNLNNTLALNANKQTTSDSENLGGMSMMGAMSNGGAVPGRPVVGGDDPKNDTVPAMLSPGELVIPRSHASSPEAAADFVRALQRRGPERLADGGTVGDGTGISQKSGTPDQRAAGALSVFLPHIGAAMRGSGVTQEAPSIQNGGLLDTANYDNTRKAQLSNAAAIQQRAGEPDPAASQQSVDATDANLAAAMAPRRGGASSSSVMLGSALGAQAGAGEAAAAAGNSQSGANSSLARTLAQQRSADLALATAKQQAAFRQTQINAGLGLEQQAAMRGIFAGAGQAAMAGSHAAGGRDTTYDLNDKNTPSFDQGLSASEWNDYPGSSAADLHGQGDELWKGGRVKKYAEGGAVEDTRGADFVRALKQGAFR